MRDKIKNQSLLFIAPTSELIAGGELSHFELIKSSRSRGYIPHVVLPSVGQFSRQLEKESISYSVVSNTWWRHEDNMDFVGTENVPAVGAIVNIIIETGAVAVITNTLHVPWGALSSAITNTPHVWIAREFPLGEFVYLSNKADYIRQLSNLVIANSKDLATHLSEKFGIPGTKHFYSFVDASNLSLNKGDGTKRRIICVGSITQRKNQLELVEALGILNTKGLLGDEVVFIGGHDKDYLEKMTTRIKELGLVSHVHFIPYSSKPWRLVNKSDIFVQCSSSESIGRTTTEAMKLGLLCIAADADGVKEGLELGGGILYKAGDPDSLASKLEQVLQNKSVASEIAQRAQKKILKNLSEKACHDPFFDELSLVLGKDHPQKELTHLKPYFRSINYQFNTDLRELANLRDHLEVVNNELNAIKSSRLYGVMNRVRSIYHNSRHDHS
jgi:glycosyltransferase involved in cell wall biosynthesis